MNTYFLLLIMCIKIFKQNININLLNYAKVYGQKSVFFIDLKLCISFNINKSNFNNILSLKTLNF